LDEVEVVKKSFFEKVEVHGLRWDAGAFAIKRFLAVIHGTKQIVLYEAHLDVFFVDPVR
jgi:hypothetical protein